MAQLWETKSSIEDAIRCLEEARDDMGEMSGECDDKWTALVETTARIEAVLVEVRKLLPMHPEIEAEIERHEDEADRYADWLASGNYPGR